jgi:hypothetical protein
MKSLFLRVLEADDKSAALLSAMRSRESALGKLRFEVDPSSFQSMPGSPFAYWVPERWRRVFTKLDALGQMVLATSGTGTLDNFRFLRLWWEVDPEARQSDSQHWPAYAKGGSYSPFYFDHHLIVNWASDGAEMKASVVARYGGGHWARNIRSTDHYFRPGLTWPRRTQRGLSVRAMPAGCIFADTGPAVFVQHDAADYLLALLAVLNSKTFRALVALQISFGSYEVGAIQRTPAPSLSAGDRSNLAALAREAWFLKRSVDSHVETSHAFVLPALLQVSGDSLTARASGWVDRVSAVEAELAVVQGAINERCSDLYDIGGHDEREVVDSVDSLPGENDDTGEPKIADTDDEEVEGEVNSSTLAAELVSWAVGVAFGRFDVRLATGTRAFSGESEVFDRLPACSSGMLTGEDGLPVDRVPAGYTLTFPETGILVDDVGHPADLTAAVRAVFDVVFCSEADARWAEAAMLLDSKDLDLRAWLGSKLFDHHLARYSKSRRKAPILWQLGTPSGHYSVWLYSHRLTRDSFFQIQNDIVGPKLAHEERQLRNLTLSAGTSPSAKEYKDIAAQETFVEELRALVDEVKRVTPLWDPALDDGVVLAMAPLWRLVTLHKPWQNELKANWDELAAGKYDWARLAMHLWPERVVPKCATDRSLAIAHGLEKIFWVEDAEGNWTARFTPTRPTDELVRERTSPAVKAALKSLLDAPSARAGNGRERRPRRVTAAAGGAI